MSRIIIIGAGISGLTTAYRVQQALPVAQVTVLEAGNRPGGVVWTEQVDGYTVEYGPNGFLDNVPATLELARELGLGKRLVPASEAARKHRYLYLHDRLHELPGGPGAFLKSPLLNWRGKLRMLAEPLIRKGPGVAESVAMFARRRFGQQAADVFIDALVTGIHGGDPDLLDVRAAFPRLSRYEAEAGSIIRGVMRARRLKKKTSGTAPAPQRMWSFPGGMRELIDALIAGLRTPPRYNSPVGSLEKTPSGWIVQMESGDTLAADIVVLACPAPVQAKLLMPIDESLSHDLQSIPYNRIAVVALGYHSADIAHPYDGFGFIAPQNTRQDLLGVQWCSAIYPARAPNGMVLWRALCGGWHRGEEVDWPDSRLIAGVTDVLRKIHGITAEPGFTRIIRWPKAIPQYMVGHPERVARIEQRTAQHRGMYLTGNCLRGVALNDCVADAARIASRLTAESHIR